MSSRIWSIALGVAALAALAIPASGSAKPGDIFIGNSGGGDIVRLRGTPIDQEPITSGGPLSHPSGLDFANGFLWVADYGITGIVRVDPKTGDQKPIVSGAPFNEAIDIEYAPNGFLYVADPFAYESGAILRVNRKTGAVKAVSKNRKFDFGPMAVVWHEGFLYVADQGGFVFRVDPKTGNQVVLAKGDRIGSPKGIAFIGDRLYIANGGTKIFRVKPNGKVEKVAVVEPASGLYDLAATPDGRLLAIGISGHAVRVNPENGKHEVISSGGILSSPEGIAIQP